MTSTTSKKPPHPPTLGNAAGKRATRLTVDAIMRQVDLPRLERLRQKAAASEGDQTYFWSKYLDVEKWIALNIRYAHELGFVEHPPRRVLDLGCGGGYFLTVCRQAGARVLGLDLDRDAILNELVAIFGLKRVAWNIQPFIKLPRFSGKFDLITAWMICFNLPLDRPAWNPTEWDFLLADLRTYLEADGRIILSLNKQLDDGLVYNDELKAYFAELGAVIDGKRLTFTAEGLQKAGVLSANVPQPPPRPRKLFNAVRPLHQPAPSAKCPALPHDPAVFADFSTESLNPASAEARTLFFLAAWRRNVATPLQLICVGEAPDTVRWLADRCETQITELPPSALRIDRAWEGAQGAERLLVLSAEVLAFADPTPALERYPANSIVAAPADRCPVPDFCWPQIYGALGVPLPREKMQPLRAELNLPMNGGGAPEMWPYYKEEVLVTPRDCAFAPLWAYHYQQITDLLPLLAGVNDEQRARLIAHASRIALATTIQALIASDAGWIYQRLPLACDGRLSYFEAAADMVYPYLLHVPGLFKRLEDLGQVRDSMQALNNRWRNRIAEGARERGFSAGPARLYAAWTNRRLEVLLRRLYQDDVRPALRACGAFG